MTPTSLPGNTYVLTSIGSRLQAWADYNLSNPLLRACV